MAGWLTTSVFREITMIKDDLNNLTADKFGRWLCYLQSQICKLILMAKGMSHESQSRGIRSQKWNRWPGTKGDWDQWRTRRKTGSIPLGMGQVKICLWFQWKPNYYTLWRCQVASHASDLFPFNVARILRKALKHSSRTVGRKFQKLLWQDILLSTDQSESLVCAALGWKGFERMMSLNECKFLVLLLVNKLTQIHIELFCCNDVFPLPIFKKKLKGKFVT